MPLVHAQFDWAAMIPAGSPELYTGAHIALSRDGSFWVAGGSKAGPEPEAFVSRLSSSGTIAFTVALPDVTVLQLTTDSAGNGYVIGSLYGNGTRFVTTPNALQRSGGNGFLVKIAPTGTVVYSTRLGPIPASIAVDADANVYLTGVAFSDFTTTSNALKRSIGAAACPQRGSTERVPCSDAFVMKVLPSGSLGYATFFGGTGVESGIAIGVDTQRNVYLTGITTSRDLPTVNALQPRYGGGIDFGLLGTYGDVFLTKLDPTGRSVVYSTYIGGAAADDIAAMYVDEGGTATLAGWTQSYDFPVSSNAFQRSFTGGSEMPGSDVDAFVVRISSAGTLLMGSYLGTRAASEHVRSLAIDPDGSRIQLVMSGPVGLLFRPALPMRCPSQQSVLTLNAATGEPVGLMPLANTTYAAGDLSPGRDGRWYVGLSAWFGPGGTGATYIGRLADGADVTVVNAASMLPGRSRMNGRCEVSFAPGEVVTLFFTSTLLGSGEGEVRVRLGDRPLRLLYAGEGQINAEIPIDAQVGATALYIEKGSLSIPVIPAGVVRSAPGIFTSNASGQGHAAALNQDGTINTADNGASAGSVVSIFATGVGDNPVKAYVNGSEVPLEYAGPAPGLLPGITQVNLRLPPETTSGQAFITISADVAAYGPEPSQENIFVYTK